MRVNFLIFFYIQTFKSIFFWYNFEVRWHRTFFGA